VLVDGGCEARTDDARPLGVSADGRTIVGHGIKPSGVHEG
jgi:hypothetical protein